MELNDYGIGTHSTGNHHSEISEQTEKYNGNGLEQIQATIPGKEQEFIDHTLLAPTYIRDSNNFIMDLIGTPVDFQKGGVVHVSTTANADTDQDGFAVKDTLASDLHFPSSIFHFVNKQENTDSEAGTVDSTLRVLNTQHQPPPLVRADGSPFTHKNAVDFTLALNADFLETSENKPFSEAAGSHRHGAAHGTVRRFPSLSLLAEPNVVALEDTGVIHDEGDILYARSNAGKVLPHKKRISRKLKVDQNDGDCPAAYVAPLEHNKLPQEERLTVVVPVVASMQFRCEICGHTTSTQIEFFSHLKQHYEPSTPDTILAAMKTSLDTLDAAPQVKNCNGVCSINNKKADDDNNVDHQVFHGVHLNFEDFHNVDDSVRNVMHQDNDMKILNSNSIANTIAAYVTQNEPTPTLKDMTTDEFSDTEDMLEGIRNVVDKVSIEETCDDIDLMSPNAIRAPWFASDSFSGITFKSKPFSDVSFSEPFEPTIQVEMENNEVETETKKRPQQQQQPRPLEIDNSNDALAQFVASNEQKIKIEENSKSGSTYYVAPLPNNSDNNSSECENAMKSDDVVSFTKDSSDGSQPRRMQLRFPKLKRQQQHQQYFVEGDECEVEEAGDDHAEDYVFDDDDDEECTEPDSLRGKKRHICAKCNREFNSGNALKYHYRTHTGIRPHQCEVCGKSFFAQGALKSHMHTHTGDKPFECDHCQRKFRQWGDLKYHTISIHSDEKSHQCEFCGKAFSRKYSLVLHRRIHTSERNYKCEYCPKTFRASSYLSNHVKIHTGEKPYECKVCTKKFRVSGDLARHKRIHQRKVIEEAEPYDDGEGEEDQNKV